jgi:hypothetical protein
MKVRKTYLLVKLPSSIPEQVEFKQQEKKSSPLTERPKEKKTSPILLENKFVPLKYRLWIHGFPGEKHLSFEKKIHCNSLSNVKNSVTPVKFRRYVESVLDMNQISTRKTGQKSFCSLSYIKKNLYEQKRRLFEQKKSVCIRGKLLPILRNHIKV